MTPQPKKVAIGLHLSAWSSCCLTATALSIALLAPVEPLSAAQLLSKDKVANRPGALAGSAKFTPDGGGRSGQPGDTAIDFGPASAGSVDVADAKFLNAATAGDELTFAFWQKKYNIGASSAFWALSPSSNNGQRGYQAHVPWDNNNIYFDSAGCCNADQRISAGVDATKVPAYTDQTWWNDWHHFVFSTKQGTKQIWVDGVLFLEGTGAHALPTDFTALAIGSGGPNGLTTHGLIDDFSVFSTALVEADIQALAGGASPSTLDASKGLVALWDFNDTPPEGQFTTILPAPDSSTADPNLVRVVHLDGKVPWTDKNITLQVDGVAVTPTFLFDNGQSTVSFVPAAPYVIQSSHKAAITYPVVGGSQTFEWSFVVGPYTLDSVATRLGSMRNGSGYSADAGGHSGAAGDRALDFGSAGTGPMVADAGFMNTASANDEMSFAFWSKKYDTANGSVFWANAPSSGGARGWQAHLPWSNNNIYFDTAGCCNAPQRINADIKSFQPYQDAGGTLSWWNDWHYYVFSKKGEDKQIWIDGLLFLEGHGAAALPVDFTSLFVGSDGGGGGLFHGLVDDLAVFSTQLVEADIQTLTGGAKASSLSPDAGLLAYWQFDDFPADGLFSSITPTPNALDADPNLIQVVHSQGTKLWDLSKVSLTLDGAKVAATVTFDQGKVTVKYVPSPFLTAKSTHTAVLTYPSGADLLTKTWKFTVGTYTLDVTHKYYGALRGAAAFSADGGGHSASPGDFALDFGQSQTGQSVDIVDASFLNDAGANNEFAVAGWQKLYSVHDSAFFWGVSPTSGGGQRGIGTHAPWSDNNFYFDTAGCCDGGSQRTSGNISTFQPYQDFGNTQDWWKDWHYIVFQKRGNTKEIWIDGQMFVTKENTGVLPVDFTRAFLGRDPVDGATSMQGLLDDVAIYKNALDESDIIALATGTAPGSIEQGASLIAYWDFNDGGVPGLRLHITGDSKAVNLTWTGGQGPYVVQRKANLSDPQWETVATTSELKATVTGNGGATGFFRVTAQ